MAGTSKWLFVLLGEVNAFSLSFYANGNKNGRDVGVKAIENLMQKKGKFDYILLETTGLADPGWS
jgi:hypothetical protein